MRPCQVILPTIRVAVVVIRPEDVIRRYRRMAIEEMCEAIQSNDLPKRGSTYA